MKRKEPHEEKNQSTSEHDHFKLGTGYGSGEKGSDALTHKSGKQYGDNPLPKSGGGYSKAGAVQPFKNPHPVEAPKK